MDVARELGELVRQHYALLYRYAYRLTGSAADAEDLTQQTFLTAQRKLDQLREPKSAKNWLFAILRNVYLKDVRDRRRESFVSMECIAELGTGSDIEFLPDQEELQSALDALPEEYRTPLILFYLEEFSYREIAEQMGTPIGTVMSRLSRGKTYLRRRLAALPAGTRP
jgi:RNA polymerase sigma-70 factor (ECF subfamily)